MTKQDNVFVRIKMSIDTDMNSREVSAAEFERILQTHALASNGVYVPMADLLVYEASVARKRRIAALGR